MSALTFVTRFAPSPTGRLHIGHAFSALTAHRAAAEAGGVFILRIEDIDTARCRAEFVDGIYEDLAWLGLSWPEPVRRQSQHLTDYRAALETLRARGLLYRCFRTRAEALADIGRAPEGPGVPATGRPAPIEEEERLMAEGRPFAWRLSLDAARRALGSFEALSFTEKGLGDIAAQPERAGDVILARKDVEVAYHLAVVVDDAAQGVTDVTRGEDLREATHVQRLLQTLLGLPTPVYNHHRLILRPDGRKFAKRDTTSTLADLRERGVTPAAVRAELGFQTHPEP